MSDLQSKLEEAVKGARAPQVVVCAGSADGVYAFCSWRMALLISARQVHLQRRGR